jgi:mRNA interferase MazF
LGTIRGIGSLVKARYFPKRGDLVWLNFTPQSGHEQAGRRPALIISDDGYNRVVGMALACPITSQMKGYAFEVPLPHGSKVKGVVLADQVRSIDWRARQVEFIAKSSDDVLSQTLARLNALINEIGV